MRIVNKDFVAFVALVAFTAKRAFIATEKYFSTSTAVLTYYFSTIAISQALNASNIQSEDCRPVTGFRVEFTINTVLYIL